MNKQPLRRVTRGYVWTLIAGSLVVAVALIVAAWGILAYATSSDPIRSPHIARWTAPALIVLALAGLAWLLWQQALALLRGRRAPRWSLFIVAIFGSFLIWCLGGMASGMAIDETWGSPFAWAIGLAWGVSFLLYWAVLQREIYTDRPMPRWPWETGEDDA